MLLNLEGVTFHTVPLVVVMILVIGAVLYPLLTLLESVLESGDADKTTSGLSSRQAWFLVLTVVATTVCGTVLLLLNWATS